MNSEQQILWRCIADGLHNEYVLIPSNDTRNARKQFKKFANWYLSADIKCNLGVSYNLLDNIIIFSKWIKHVK